MNAPPPKSTQELHQEIQRLRQAVEELRLLNDIALMTSGADSLEAMLTMIIDESLKVVDAEQGSIVLVTDNAGTALKTLIRQDNRSSLRHSYHVGTHLIGSVVYDRKPLLIEDLATDPRFTTNDQERADIRSVLCVPMINQGRFLGVLMMVNKKGIGVFSANDQRLLMILGAQAGQLIVNAHLRDDAAHKKEELSLARLEAEKWRELDELKSRFFADISHEFRTPLTLILGPIEQLIEGSRKDDPLADFRLIRRNAHRLLRLINDLLDLSRLEAGSMTLRLAEGDLVPFLQPIVDAFRPVADQQAVTLRFAPVVPAVHGVFDRQIVETVSYNLLSNALKFTPAHGTVVVTLSPVENPSSPVRWIALTVADTGRGIPAERTAHLFDRYYQVEDADRKSGSGLGLAVTKGLVELHHGTITVTSNTPQGSLFEVKIPIDRDCYVAAEFGDGHNARGDPGPEHTGFTIEAPEPRPPSTPPQPTDAEAPLLLIVEDDPDMRRYLCENLKHSFRILEASDGEIGLSIARDIIPDVVLSDVGMPVVDGIQLCRNLKEDERTSHVPVLFLTAGADQDRKLAGLESGADDYLTKPFVWKEMETRLHNLVEGRRRLRERFSRSTLLKPSEIAITSMDEAFLGRVLAVIQRSMGDETFSVEDLARDVAMSYSQLHRKLTALVNQSPNQLIRSMRLQRAKELIERDAGTISEIAYTVGFNSPAYMTKCFHEHFGIVPSQARPRRQSPPPNA